MTAVRYTLMEHDSVAPTMIGAGTAARSLSRVGAKKNLVLLVDARVAEQHPALSSRARHVFVFDPRLEAQRAWLERAHAEIRRESADHKGSPAVDGIVAIGGGSVLDAAKLLRLLLASAPAFHSVCHAAESFGVSTVPEGWAPEAPSLTLIPTTFGTGSEASAVACLCGAGTSGSRRLVVGALMRADSVALDASLTRSLDDMAVRQGSAEIMLRVLGSYIGSPARAVPDRAAEELVSRVAALADAGIRRGFDDGLREELAVASGETHTGWALVGRNPYAAKHWYLANELSSASLLGKVPVTLALLPAIWGRIIEGDTRLGDVHRLRRLWRIVAETLAIPEDPVSGAAEWATAWGIPSPLTTRDALVTAARSAFEVWGGTRPALHGLTESDVLSIYVSAFVERGQRPLSTSWEEVN